MSSSPSFNILVASAAAALRDRAEEVNRLNVFPVPDGDTGTNMALTMEAVVSELNALPSTASLAERCHAVAHGSLMGARGNSGVILSQILRGLSEIISSVDGEPDAAEVLARALERATEVSFQAVRKPVEGTMLTVLRDAASAARSAVERDSSFDSAVDATLAEIVESVRRTPDLLPILRENNVVDAGGLGLAILCEALVATWRGAAFDESLIASAGMGAGAVVPVDDWDDDEFLYCTEFIFHGNGVDKGAIDAFLASAGGSELAVGTGALYKVHVHTNDPGGVLAYMTSIGEVSDVHINNMRLQSAQRADSIELSARGDVPTKPIGVVAVSAGEGLSNILKSLGVDAIVNGGQSMNPSTAEILEAVESVRAEAVVVLPNNKNIHLAAQQVPELASRPTAIVPTTSVPEAFSAMLAFDPSSSLDANREAMTRAYGAVRTGEVTVAVKDSSAKAGAVKKGQVIGIADHEIEVVGDDVLDVAVALVDLFADSVETLTILGGSELPESDRVELASRVSAKYPDLEVEHHDGGQPLYPVILSGE